MRRREFLELKYTTDVKTLMTVECDSGFSVEVFGDGANGSYEWRLVDEAGLVEQHSDSGYGIPAIALLDGLIAFYGVPHGNELEHVAGRKEQELRLWHFLLNDEKAAWYRPEFQLASLRKHAEVLHRFGIIDGNELIELNELADARYGYAIEALETRLEHPKQ